MCIITRQSGARTVREGVPMPHRHETDKESQETVWYSDRGKHKEKLEFPIKGSHDLEDLD